MLLMQNLCEEMHRYKKMFLMDTVEILVDATRIKNESDDQFFREKRISCTFGSNISLVIANVPLEIKHEHVAMSDIEL